MAAAVRLPDEGLSPAGEDALPRLSHAWSAPSPARQEASKAKRTWLRTLLMHGFHFLVALVVGRSIRDTQCGCKVGRPGGAPEGRACAVEGNSRAHRPGVALLPGGGTRRGGSLLDRPAPRLPARSMQPLCSLRSWSHAKLHGGCS